MPSVLWFRRDLRLRDHPALVAAAEDAPVVPLFVVDPALARPAAGSTRAGYLAAALRALDAPVVLRSGDPVAVVRQVAAEVGASAVHVSADAGPYGRRRDAAVAARLASEGRRLVATGSPYAVTPGRLPPVQVYSAYLRAWRGHGWPSPAPLPRVRWRALDGERLPDWPSPVPLPPAGEAAGRARWEEFRAGELATYADHRDRPDLDATSRLSHHLRWGELHPRTLLAGLGHDDEVFRRELAWREFYAAVLWARPDAVRAPLDARFARLAVDEDAERFATWAQGRTGYPLVDAAMRQLRSEGWVHNRARMVAASFLVKDLHLPWQQGAREFLRWLRDGDLASNHLGWQWVTGTGTDAAPFVRVFNPVLQGRRTDPSGDYVRRHVAELRAVAGEAVHEPEALPGGPPAGYPRPIVEHQAERREALRRYADVRGR